MNCICASADHYIISRAQEWLSTNKMCILSNTRGDSRSLLRQNKYVINAHVSEKTHHLILHDIWQGTKHCELCFVIVRQVANHCFQTRVFSLSEGRFDARTRKIHNIHVWVIFL